MKILSIEIEVNSAIMVFIEGNKNSFQVYKSGKFLSIPKDSDEIEHILEFQTNFSMFIQDEPVDLVVLCEGGSDSKRRRIRMEFAILSECVKQNMQFVTYATSACTKLISETYEKQTGGKFYDDLESRGLPKYMNKALVAGWRFIK